MRTNICICICFLTGLLLAGSLAHSQGVGIGTTTPNAAAVLELRSPNQGLLLPRIVDTTHVTKPVAGLLVFSTSDNGLYFYSGFSWVRLASASNTAPVTFVYNGASVTYGALVSPTTGRIWLDRNLGAGQPADSSRDYRGYGDLFQWGRLADGHQVINWGSSSYGKGVNGTTSTLSASDVPGNSSFIRSNIGPQDWRIVQNNRLWQGVDGINNPCPNGWHVPGIAEWSSEKIADVNTAYYLLKLPAPGYRNAADGTIFPAAGGYYWSSSIIARSSPRELVYNSDFLGFFPSDHVLDGGHASRANGYSVRCIQ